MPTEQSKRPWDKRSQELEETEGFFCDFAAWREWMVSKYGGDDILGQLDSFSDETNIYTMFCEAYDGQPATSIGKKLPDVF